MRQRAIIHVAGPTGAGKTTFLERLLDAEVAAPTCVRAERDSKRRKELVSSPKSHEELRRYRDAGAETVALYRFGRQDHEAFFTSDFMQEYSEAVFIEGDRPLESVDLAVFVAPPPPPGGSLLRRERRDRAAEYKASIERMARALESLEGTIRLVGGGLGERFVAMALQQPDRFEDVRRSLRSRLAKAKRAPAPEPTEHWALAEDYDGIEHAQLVLVNVREEGERREAEMLIEELGRIRKDDAVFQDILGHRGSKVPITAVVADLSSPKDAGLQKAVARVRRTIQRRGT